jgi:hypothetical protein
MVDRTLIAKICNFVFDKQRGSFFPCSCRRQKFLRESFLTCPRAPNKQQRLLEVRRQGVLKTTQHAIVLAET